MAGGWYVTDHAGCCAITGDGWGWTCNCPGSGIVKSGVISHHPLKLDEQGCDTGHPQRCVSPWEGLGWTGRNRAARTGPPSEVWAGTHTSDQGVRREKGGGIAQARGLGAWAPLERGAVGIAGAGLWDRANGNRAVLLNIGITEGVLHWTPPTDRPERVRKQAARFVAERPGSCVVGSQKRGAEPVVQAHPHYVAIAGDLGWKCEPNCHRAPKVHASRRAGPSSGPLVGEARATLVRRWPALCVPTPGGPKWAAVIVRRRGPTREEGRARSGT